MPVQISRYISQVWYFYINKIFHVFYNRRECVFTLWMYILSCIVYIVLYNADSEIIW